MPIKVANVIYWGANCLALVSLAGFSYAAMQPNAYNPLGMVSVGIGLACILWLGGKTCQYASGSRQLVTKSVCAGCGHVGAIAWTNEGDKRKFASSSCFHQRPDGATVLCNHCGTSLLA